MKLYLKQLSALFALFLFDIIVVPFLIFYFGRILYQFRISNFFIHYRETNDLLLMVLNFLIGYFLVNKIKLLKPLKNWHIIAFFFTFYMGIILFNKVGTSNFHTINISSILGNSLKELSFLIAFIIGVFFRKKKSIILPLTILFLFLIFTKKITLPFSSQYYLYKNFTGKSNNQNRIDTLELINKNNEQIELIMSDKTVVIDFWNKNCGLCFQKFPLVKEIQNKYKTKDSILVITLNIYKDKKDIAISEGLLKDTNNQDLIRYYLAKDKADAFNLKWYPTTVVIKDGKIVFEGHIEILKLLEKLYLE